MEKPRLLRIGNSLFDFGEALDAGTFQLESSFVFIWLLVWHSFNQFYSHTEGLRVAFE